MEGEAGEESGHDPTIIKFSSSLQRGEIKKDSFDREYNFFDYSSLPHHAVPRLKDRFGEIFEDRALAGDDVDLRDHAGRNGQRISL